MRPRRRPGSVLGTMEGWPGVGESLARADCGIAPMQSSVLVCAPRPSIVSKIPSAPPTNAAPVHPRLEFFYQVLIYTHPQPYIPVVVFHNNV